VQEGAAVLRVKVFLGWQGEVTSAARTDRRSSFTALLSTTELLNSDPLLLTMKKICRAHCVPEQWLMNGTLPQYSCHS
jgi:hypothetical protein